MARKGTVRLLVFFSVLITGIIAALFWESFVSGPTFRAADYDSREECVANIPDEWAPGSIERLGATEACAWEHSDQGSGP